MGQVRSYAAGQAVVVVLAPAWRRIPPTITADVIDKIGRRWITLASGKRFDPETGEVDGGQYESDETVWPSAEAYARHAQRRAHWGVLRAYSVGEDPPDTLDDETLARVAEALGPGAKPGG